MGLILKLISEQINGPSLGVESLIAATVMINAHLYGAIAGVIYFSIRQLKKNNKNE